MRTIIKKRIKAIVALVLVICILVLVPNFAITLSTRGDIKGDLTDKDDVFTSEELADLKMNDPQCIMVLGASVRPDGSPSPMLRQRLDGAVQLYKAGVAPKILLTGDYGQTEYNELATMFAYMMDNDIPSEDVFCDYAGFSTYDSAYRASYIFEVERAVVVTQRYHLYRSIYGCERMGIDAVGAATDQTRYLGQTSRDIREVLARYKDFAKWIIKPNPKYLGEHIPITGSGDATRD